MNTGKIVMVLAIALCLWSCAPDYPDTEYHRAADNDDCINCHVTRSVSVPNDFGPDVPSSHRKGDAPQKDHKDCKGCHEMAR